MFSQGGDASNAAAGAALSSGDAVSLVELPKVNIAASEASIMPEQRTRADQNGTLDTALRGAGVEGEAALGQLQKRLAR